MAWPKIGSKTGQRFALVFLGVAILLSANVFLVHWLTDTETSHVRAVAILINAAAMLFVFAAIYAALNLSDAKELADVANDLKCRGKAMTEQSKALTEQSNELAEQSKSLARQSDENFSALKTEIRELSTTVNQLDRIEERFADRLHKLNSEWVAEGRRLLPYNQRLEGSEKLARYFFHAEPWYTRLTPDYAGRYDLTLDVLFAASGFHTADLILSPTYMEYFFKRRAEVRNGKSAIRLVVIPNLTADPSRGIDWDLLMFLNYSVRAGYQTYVALLTDLAPVCDEIQRRCGFDGITIAGALTPAELITRHPAISCVVSEKNDLEYFVVKAEFARSTVDTAAPGVKTAPLELDRRYGAVVGSVLLNRVCTEAAWLNHPKINLNDIPVFISTFRRLREEGEGKKRDALTIGYR